MLVGCLGMLSTLSPENKKQPCPYGIIEGALAKLDVWTASTFTTNPSIPGQAGPC